MCRGVGGGAVVLLVSSQCGAALLVAAGHDRAERAREGAGRLRLGRRGAGARGWLRLGVEGFGAFAVFPGFLFITEKLQEERGGEGVGGVVLLRHALGEELARHGAQLCPGVLFDADLGAELDGAADLILVGVGEGAVEARDARGALVEWRLGGLDVLDHAVPQVDERVDGALAAGQLRLDGLVAHPQGAHCLGGFAELPGLEFLGDGLQCLRQAGLCRGSALAGLCRGAGLLADLRGGGAELLVLRHGGEGGLGARHLGWRAEVVHHSLQGGAGLGILALLKPRRGRAQRRAQSAAGLLADGGGGGGDGGAKGQAVVVLGKRFQRGDGLAVVAGSCGGLGLGLGGIELGLPLGGIALRLGPRRRGVGAFALGRRRHDGFRLGLGRRRHGGRDGAGLGGVGGARDSVGIDLVWGRLGRGGGFRLDLRGRRSLGVLGVLLLASAQHEEEDDGEADHASRHATDDGPSSAASAPRLLHRRRAHRRGLEQDFHFLEELAMRLESLGRVLGAHSPQQFVHGLGHAGE